MNDKNDLLMKTYEKPMESSWKPKENLIITQKLPLDDVFSSIYLLSLSWLFSVVYLQLFRSQTRMGKLEILLQIVQCPSADEGRT